MKRNLLSLAAVATLPPAGLHAATPAGELMPGLGRLVVAFAIVLALIFVSVRLFRRLSLKGRGAGRGRIRLIDSFPLHQRAKLSVIEVAGRVFLISVTDHDVSMIAEYDPMEFAEKNEKNVRGNFVTYLQMFRRRNDSADDASIM